eukprot:9395069-Lingulodinium_polyedra.AAC.1
MAIATHRVPMQLQLHWQSHAHARAFALPFAHVLGTGFLPLVNTVNNRYNRGPQSPTARTLCHNGDGLRGRISRIG